MVPKTPLGQGDRDLAEAVSSREGLQVNAADDYVSVSVSDKLTKEQRGNKKSEAS